MHDLQNPMSETVTEKRLEELKEKVRTGWQLWPDTPGLAEAARQVIRPLVQDILNRQIIYNCRVSWLAHVDELEVTDTGFSARTTLLHQYHQPHMPLLDFSKPFEFSGTWAYMHLCGKWISKAMVTDCFITDAAFIAEVEAKRSSGASAAELVDMLAGGPMPLPTRLKHLAKSQED